MNIENELDNIWKVIHEFEFRIENQRAAIKKHQEEIDDAKTAMHYLREILGLESEVEKAKREELQQLEEAVEESFKKLETVVCKTHKIEINNNNSNE